MDPSEATSSSMEAAVQSIPPPEDRPQGWSFGEFAALAGWFFFGCGCGRSSAAAGAAVELLRGNQEGRVGRRLWTWALRHGQRKREEKGTRFVQFHPQQGIEQSLQQESRRWCDQSASLQRSARKGRS